jgi:hypothetical protein
MNIIPLVNDSIQGRIVIALAIVILSPAIVGCQQSGTPTPGSRTLSTAKDSTFTGRKTNMANDSTIRTIQIATDWWDTKHKKIREIAFVKLSDTTVYHGICSLYSKMGVLTSTSEYRNGKKDGDVVLYYPSGKVSCRWVVHNDQRDGWYVPYYPNGQIVDSMLFIDGRLWSITCMYDSLGKSLDFGHIQDGNGSVRIYYPDGSSSVGQVLNGWRHGEWKIKYVDGKESCGVLYEEGFQFQNGIKDSQRSGW